MSAAADFDPIAEASKRPRARLTGAVYMLYFLTAVLAAFLESRAPVPSIAVNLVATAFYVALTVLFYDLFKPVSMRLSLLAAIVASSDALFWRWASFISSRRTARSSSSGSIAC